MRNIERQVYFYNIRLQKFDNKNSYQLSEDYKGDLKDIFARIDALPFDKINLDNSRYIKKQNGTYDFVEIYEIKENEIKGKLINTDDGGLEYYEQQGELHPLREKLPESATVAHVSHFIIYLDTNMMAFEYNFKSSHAPSLEKYIQEKTNGQYYIDFNNLLNNNKKKIFESITKVKSFEFTASSKLLLANQASRGGFFSAADATFALSNNETDVEQIVTIKMKPKRISKKNKNPYYDASKLKESINSINADENNSENLFSLDIVGINELNERVAVNYTNEYITRKIVLPPNKTEAADFYEKIAESYAKVYKKYLG